MARYKTKKQKKKAAKKIKNFAVNPVNLEKSDTSAFSSALSSSKNVKSEIIINKKRETPTTVFSKSQVKLLYRDLFKTLVVTIIVFTVLLSIFLYMR
jgi:hypothetical protein